MKLLILPLLLFFTSLAFSNEMELIFLPIDKSGLSVKGEDGVELVRRVGYELEFKDMKVFVHKDSRSKTFVYIPKSKCDAAIEFKRLLPTKYYQRLVAAYNENTREVGGISDAAVEERIYDLHSYLNDIWKFDSKNMVFNTEEMKSFELIWILIDINIYGCGSE